MKRSMWGLLLCCAWTGGCFNFVHTPSGTMDFGTVLVGDYDRRSVSWKNTSTRTAQLGQPALVTVNGGAVFSTDVSPIQNANLASGQSAGPMTIEFKPTDAVRYGGLILPSGTLQGSNAAFNPETLKIKGRGAYRIIKDVIIDSPGFGNADALDFGDVVINTTKTLTFQISVPSGHLRATMRRFRPPEAAFAAPDRLDVPADPQSLTVQVRFTPTQVKAYEGGLQYVTVNLALGEIMYRFSVTLKGNGVAPPSDDDEDQQQ